MIYLCCVGIRHLFFFFFFWGGKKFGICLMCMVGCQSYAKTKGTVNSSACLVAYCPQSLSYVFFKVIYMYFDKAI